MHHTVRAAPAEYQPQIRCRTVSNVHVCPPAGVQAKPREKEYDDGCAHVKCHQQLQTRLT